MQFQRQALLLRIGECDAFGAGVKKHNNLLILRIKFYILNAKGEFAGVTMYAKINGRPQNYAVCTEAGPETRPMEGLLEEQRAS